MAAFVPTVNFAAVALAAGNGSTPAGVQMTLSASDIELAIELMINRTATGVRSDVTEDGTKRRTFTLWWAFSALNLAGAQLNNPTLGQYLRSTADSMIMHLRDDLMTTLNQQIMNTNIKHIRGPFLYLWLEAPGSPDAYTFTVTTTEITTH